MQATMKEYLEYNPSTGNFKWIKSIGFKERGTPCGNGPSISLKGERCSKAKLAFLWVTGIYPVNRVSFVDGDSLNFKFANLLIPSSIKTPNVNHVDISLIVTDDSYHIFIVENGVGVDLGIHDTSDEAFKIAKGYLCLRSTQAK